MLRRTLIFVLAAAGALSAQDPPSRAGRISYVSGAVSFQPAGVTDWVAATVNRPLTIGDQLYADSGARAEVHVPGAAFRLGDRTAFQFMNLDDRTVQVRLSEGTLHLRVRNLYGNIEIDTPNMAFTVTRPGVYRIDTSADNGQTLVTTRDGAGQVTAGGGSFALVAGQQAVVTGQDQSAQYQVNAAPGLDGFDQWAMSRETRVDRYARSSYVSPQVVGYEDLGEYGTWRTAGGYGQVWVPNGVSAGWAPYHDGHWAWVDPWGWTWVDDAPWGFAPFHYGRWAHLDGYWGWCPGPAAAAAVYAPALVAWVGFGGGFGVSVGIGGGEPVGWFALGPRDVYIPAFGASAAFVNRINVTNTHFVNVTNVTNVYNAYTRTQTIPVGAYMNRSVPGAVMAVPQNALTSARPVQQAALRVQPNQIAAIRSAGAAPRVAPQMASVLGRSTGGNVARPPAAVLSRPVVARTAPPPPPASFQQRQTLLARNPGRPLAVSQMHQLASARGAAAQPQVRVMSHPRPVTPQVAHAGAPANLPANRPAPMPARPAPPQAAQQHTAPPRSGTAGRTFEPPTAQHAAAPPQPSRTPARTSPPPAAQPQHAHATPPPQPSRTPTRTFQPPAAQPQHAHATAPPQPSRTPSRTFQPPAAQPQHARATPPSPQRTAPPPPAHSPQATPQHHAAAPQRAPSPAPRPKPQPQRSAASAPRSAPPPRPAPQRASAPPPRPAPQRAAAPPPAQHSAPPARPQPSLQAQHRPPAAPAHQAPQERKP